MATLTSDERSKLVQMLRVFGAALGSTVHWRFGDEPLPSDPAAQRGGARLLVELFGISGARRLFEYERRSGGVVLTGPGRALRSDGDLDVMRGIQGVLWLVCAAVEGDHEVQETLGVWRAASGRPAWDYGDDRPRRRVQRAIPSLSVRSDAQLDAAPLTSPSVSGRSGARRRARDRPDGLH